MIQKRPTALSLENPIEATHLARLVDVGRALHRGLSQEELLNLCVDEAAALTNAEAAAMVLIDAQQDALRCVASTHVLTPPVESGRAIVPLTHTVAGQVYKSGQAHSGYDLATLGARRSTFSFLSRLVPSDLLVVPIVSSSGETVGAIELINRVDGAFDENDEWMVATLADYAAIALTTTQLIHDLRRTQRENSELERLKNESIALLSHELQSPLAVIMGYVSLLREQSQGETSRQLDRVLRAGVRLRSLVQDMLILRYIDAGQTELDLSHFDLGDVARQAAAEHAERIAEKQVKLQLRVGERPLPVIGDRQMLTLVIDVLIKNALKFTPAGGRIGIISGERDAQAWMCIADTGRGIPPQELDRIFHRFYQVEPSLQRSIGGLGLGLAIAKDLVELQAGHIWAESTPGEGSRFHISLPLVQASF